MTTPTFSAIISRLVFRYMYIVFREGNKCNKDGAHRDQKISQLAALLLSPRPLAEIDGDAVMVSGFIISALEEDAGGGGLIVLAGLATLVRDLEAIEKTTRHQRARPLVSSPQR
jgi:hypothetical protein